MKTTVCFWCNGFCQVRDDFDEQEVKPVCCRGCKDAESIFSIWMSDEEINRRAHYRYLTRGENNE